MTVLLEEENVTAVKLSLELERAVIQHELQEDGGLYITEDSWFPCWVRILKNSGFVGFTTYITFRKSSTHLQRLELANLFNKKNYLTTAFVDGEKLIIDHVLGYRGGMLTETFIRGCRQYSASIGRSLSDFDPDYQVLLPLGETESEDAESE